MTDATAMTLASALALLVAAPAGGDQEAANRPHVTASSYGAFYAKSVPAAMWHHQLGATSVFRVEAGEDVLVHSYPWFAQKIYLEGFAGSNTVYVVRMGPWARGNDPQPDHLAFAIYKGGELVRTVSTADLVGLGATAQRSVSHYTVINRVVGIRRTRGSKMVFEIVVAGELRLAFDLDTGEVVPPEQEALETRLEEARRKISSIKSQWRSSRGEVAGTGDHLVTEEDLRSVAPLPELPPGYVYVPSKIWEPVRIEPLLPLRQATDRSGASRQSQ